MNSLGKFASSLFIKKKSIDPKELAKKLKEERMAKMPDIPEAKMYVRFHWIDDKRFHNVAIFSRREQRIVYRYTGHSPVAEIEYTNRHYGGNKMIHREEEYRD